MATAADEVLDDLLDPAALRDPYPWYARLRAREPVHWNPRWKGWVVTGYDACAEIIRDTGHFSSERLQNRVRTATGGPDLLERFPNIGYIGQWVSFVDPPDHTRLRRLVNKAFTPRAVARLDALMEEATADLLDAIPAGREVDFIPAFAYPFPLRVIAGLLGLPTADGDKFKAWSDDILLVILGGSGTPDRYERADRGLGAMADYLRDQIAARRREPRDDMISALVAAREADDALTEDEIIATCMILLFGGHETSTNLLAHALLALARHPDQYARLRADPGLLATGVDEFLRYDGPSKGFIRWAREDVSVDGRLIEAGQRVLVLIAAANRDPAHFADPDALDLGRRPNDHLGFGRGVHYCLGAALARAEATTSLRQIAARYPSFAVATDRLEWHPTMLSRSLTTFPVVLRDDPPTRS